MPDIAMHRALGVFVGDWHAAGTNYGGDSQSVDNPHGEPSPWRSIHTARWHSGGFFVVQDERANGPFDTLSLLGWDLDEQRYFARTVENHGFSRDYTMTVEADTWTLSGEWERATYEFADAGRRQTIAWQRKVGEHWLPLCDRVAHRVD